MKNLFYRFTNLPNIILLANSILLFLATGRHPYSYYSTLRWIVFGSMAYLVYHTLESETRKLAVPLYVGIGVVFNPVLPIYMNRSAWFWVDIIVGIGLLVTIYFNREKKVEIDI